MKVGLFFGSFNPIHKGHTAIARYMANKTDLDRVWLVVSPHNPLKDKRDLADGKKRLAQVKKAIGRSNKIRVSNIEFGLPQPSYTITTLKLLKKKHPQTRFVLIMGFDNLLVLHKWKDYKKILKLAEIYVYPRKVSFSKAILTKLSKYSPVTFFNAPRINISSTFIRGEMKKGKNIRKWLA